MSNIEFPEYSEVNEESQEDHSLSPKSQMHAMFQELEVMAMQRGARNSLDISKLDKEQIDRVLETMAENEKNAFAFHTKRIDAIKEIELRRIEASVINQRTSKIVLIGISIVVLPLITLLILFFKESFFIPWLTFLTGIFGGFGLSKVTSNIFKTPDVKNPIKNDDSID